MTLSIPSLYKDGLAVLLTYSEAGLRDLQDAVSDAAPHSSLRTYSRLVARTTGLEQEGLADVLYAVGSLNSARENLGLTSQEVVQELKSALEADEDQRLHPKAATWPAIEAFLEATLEEGSSLVLTSKAASLETDYSHTFCSTKVLSDLRPVFRKETEPPVAAVAVHTLRISYHKASREIHDFYVTLNKRQLLALKGVVDRALRKDDQLKKLSDGLSLTLLEDQD